MRASCVHGCCCFFAIQLVAEAQKRTARAEEAFAHAPSSSLLSLRLRVVRLLTPGASLSEEQRFLQLVQRVPAEQANDAETVLAAQRDYQILKSSRQGLKNLFVTALTLALMLTLNAER